MNTKKGTPDVAEPCTKQQLAKELGVSISTLKRKLKQSEMNVPRGLIPPKTKQDILQKLKWW
jgi:DNA-binding LacI/PurR family transcriptional regulator